MSSEESTEVRLEDEQEKVLTIRISLEGPSEVLSWFRENRPRRFRGRVSDLFPNDFRRHLRAARREQLLAVRSLLDGAIRRMEQEEKPERQARSVEIE